MKKNKLSFLFLLLILNSTVVWAQCSSVCTTMGTSGTWVCPVGVTSVTVQCWGGGGAGGGVNATSLVSGGGGGAGGSFAQGVVVVIPGNTYNIVVGAGGTGASAAVGGTGGTSSFGGTSVVAVGGAGGNAGVNAFGTGAAGSTTGNTGTTVRPGGNGAAATSGTRGGGGGGGAGTTANGGNGSGATAGTGGATGGGAGGNGAATLGAATAGSTGTAPGGAGGGAYTNVVGSAAGGNGGAGQVIICYTPPSCSGTPSGGTSSASPASLACSGGTVTLSNTASQLACGITGQWQSSTNGTTWANIGGATGSSYTPTVTSSTYYRYVATCTVSTLSAPSNTIQVVSTSTTACYTCFDGIQNQGETGVDCGGPCALSCTTNSAVATTSCACPTSAAATVYSTTCAQVGTSSYDLNSPVVSFVSCASATMPSPVVSCAGSGGASNDGTWVHLDLGAGTTQIQLSLQAGGSIGSGSSAVWAAVYQGASCGALAQVGACQRVESFISGSYAAYSALFTGLNPSLDAWIYMYNDGGKSFSLPYQIVGSATAPTNTTCSSPSAFTGSGCNLGAPGASFTPPGPGGVACTGGNWGSNENTVYYSFTPTATTATLSINNIICNDGSAGSQQFGIWTSCAAVGTYGASFLGCAVGTGAVNMTGLTAGATYYLVSDGSAGSNCTWTFNTANIIILPITWLDFDAFKDGNNIKLFWSTATEINASHFDVERSDDGSVFSTIGNVKAAGNTSERRDYTFTDYSSENKQIYYRLKQYDLDGTFAYSKIIFVDLDAETKEPEIFFDENDKLITIKSYSKGFDNYDVDILDPFGKSAMESQKTDFQTENTYSIPVHSLPKGVYIINMKSNEGYKSYTKKIVVY